MANRIEVIAVALLGLAGGQSASMAFDTQSATEELARHLREDLQRQRARERREEAADVDLSEFGRRVQEPDARPEMRRSRRAIQCTTIHLGGGDFATDCD